jgi:putative tryptophan/tyrosine transport system substrate-binding protein
MGRHHALPIIAAILLQFGSQAEGQQAVHRIGVLETMEVPQSKEALLAGLSERGYALGQNLQIEYRYSQARTEQIPALVAELAAFGPEVIVAANPQNVVAVHAAAPTIPLLFIAVADPVALGLAESLAHPGGNVTGFATIVPQDFTGRQLQFLKDLIPQASRIAMLANPTNPMHQRERARLTEIGRALRMEFVVVEASGPDQLETAFQTAHSEGAEGMHVWGDALTYRHSATVVRLAAQYRIPAIYLFRQSVLDGGLISYGPNLTDFWRRAADYVDKILKGEKAGDLPVQQPNKFDLVVNVKTAAALGITVPPSVLALADEVIE